MHRGVVALFPVLALAACTKDAPAPAPFGYAPAGCAYAVSVAAPSQARGLVDPALDDANDRAAAVPTRVRLGLGGRTTQGAPGYADPSSSAVLVWEADGRASKARIGLAPDALQEVHAGHSFATLPPDVGVGSDEPQPRVHEVHVCGLAAGRTYYYQVGGGAAGSEAWSATQSFTTVPAAGKITVGVSGDSRDSMDIFQKVQQRMRDAAVAFQIFSGDLVFFGTKASAYADWLDHAAADGSGSLTLGRQLIVAAAGNHEAESAQFFGNFALPGDGPYAETFASFDAGSAHFIVLDDEAISRGPDSDEAKAQLAWLDQDLARAQANRAARPFIVVDHHRGDFSTAEHASDVDVVAARRALIPLWHKYGVDLVIAGHDHEYERSKALTGAPDAVEVAPSGGTTYVICAGAGAGAFKIGTTPSPYREKNVAFGSGTPFVGVYAFLTLDGTKLTFDAYGLSASGADPHVDSFTFSR
jgi:Calcineurin-like phosphoesterase/Purple acid Phosphatase, N-terminal domain